jgi:hypothetical protein
MGFFDDLTSPIGIWGSTRQELSKNLATASGYLEHAEMIFHEKHKIGEYKSKIDMTVKVLNAPETAASIINDLKSTMQIAKAVSDLRKIKYLHNDPDRAAYAFGRLFAGIGKLSKYLPPPVNGYFEIFADAEMFFVNVRRNMSEKTHMKEPGARELAEQGYPGFE